MGVSVTGDGIEIVGEEAAVGCLPHVPKVGVLIQRRGCILSCLVDRVSVSVQGRYLESTNVGLPVTAARKSIVDIEPLDAHATRRTADRSEGRCHVLE